MSDKKSFTRPISGNKTTFFVWPDIAKKQYQGSYKAFISIKDNKNLNEPLIKKEKKKYNKSNYSKLIFYSYSCDKNFDSLSFKSKYSCLLSFYEDFQNMIKMKATKLDKIKQKKKCIIQ